MVKSEPPWNALPGGFPPTARLFLRRCLHKERKQRVGDIRDMRLALEGAFDASENAGTAALACRGRALSTPLALAGVAAFAGLAAIAASMFRAPVPVAREVRLQVETRPGDSESWLISFALSPNGNAIVFEGAADGERPRLWLRALAVTPRPDESLDLGSPTPLFAMPTNARIVATQDGQRFLLDAPAGRARNTLLDVVD
ncbi:MAG: hypothetical protein AB7I50_23620, partial [Vicinamibacterales bacterium]